MKKFSATFIVLLMALIMVARLFNFNGYHSITHQRSKTNDGISTANSNDVLDRNTKHLILTKHARCRMECRHINETELLEILHDGNVNTNKTKSDYRGTTYAFEGYTHEHQHLRVVFAPASDGLVVVTCIDLDNEWACGNCDARSHNN